MEIAILGFGEQGRAAFEYWSNPDNHITICDQKHSIEVPDGAGIQLGDNYLENLEHFDVIVRSPSIHPRDIIAANTPNILKRVTTVTNEFFRVCPTKNIIGVTGTKGKGTTSTIITKMLETAGKRVHLGGNIGTPPLELLKNDIQPDDWVVLELANFQLIDLKLSPRIGICLMVTEEHLNWHEDMNEYITAKQQMFVHQRKEDAAIFYPDNVHSKTVVSASPGRKIPYLQAPGAVVEANTVSIDGLPICSVKELKLLGKHNWQNICAAVTATWLVVQDREAIHSVLATFKGLEHRIELVREMNGVRYYDDSFGTTPETAMVAIQAFEQPKIVIMGGSDKGANFDELGKVVATNKVKKVVLVGDVAQKIEMSLIKAGFNKSDILSGGNSMLTMVKTARANALAGDVVLLSPAAASFGMFKNYKDRGEQFKQTVTKLLPIVL